MLIPSTYAVALALSLLSMLCWGSWANTFKLSKKWRFELFYFDYTIGLVLAALVAAFTFGSMGEGMTFLDNLDISGKRQWAYAIAGGGVFNLANMLLVAAISLAGMSVAFPIGIGLALIIGVVGNYLVRPAGNAALLFGGVLLVAVAIVVCAMAYARYAAGKGKVQVTNVKGLLLSVAAGILMGAFYPLVELSMASEIGLGPYAVGAMFSIGVVITTLVFNLYFMNLPVQGPPIPLSAYAAGSLRNHLLGVAGGVLWMIGACSNFVAASTPPPANVGPAVSYALGQGATMVSALWGILVWKEFKGANRQTRTLLALMFILFIAGLAMVSLAPVIGSAQ